MPAHLRAVALALVAFVVLVHANVDERGEVSDENFVATVGDALPLRTSPGKFCAGGYYTAVVTDDGAVQLWGMVAGAVRSRRAVALPLTEPVVEIACGSYHLLIRVSSGAIFSLGRNDLGQAGVADLESVRHPKLLPELLTKQPRLVAAGAEHSLVLMESGELWGFGSTQMNQLMLSSKKMLRNFPVALDTPAAFRDVVALCAGGQHSAALTGSGDVLTWGAAAFGQLGRTKSPGAAEHSDLAPAPVTGLDGSVKSIHCGGDHTFAVTSDGLYGWGWGEMGQLANGATAEVAVATAIPLPDGVAAADIVSLCGGYAHSAMVVSGASGSRVFTAGWNTRGQLGVGDRSNRNTWTEVHGLSNARAVGCGFKHTSIQLDTGVAVVGDNAFFQLGYEVVPWSEQMLKEYDDSSFADTPPVTSEPETQLVEPDREAELKHLMKAIPELTVTEALKLIKNRHRDQGNQFEVMPDDDSATDINSYRTA